VSAVKALLAAAGSKTKDSSSKATRNIGTNPSSHIKSNASETSRSIDK
jgi:hypothetical protein